MIVLFLKFSYFKYSFYEFSKYYYGEAVVFIQKWRIMITVFMCFISMADLRTMFRRQMLFVHNDCIWLFTLSKCNVYPRQPWANQ